MIGKKKIIEALPTLDERELTLVWRDVRRAADAAAIRDQTVVLREQNRLLERIAVALEKEGSKE